MSLLMRRPNNGTSIINRMQNEMEDVFLRLFGSNGDTASAAEAWAPSVDVEETDNAVLVKADLPGVAPKDVEITIQNGCLVLRGEKNEKREDKGKNYHRVERFNGTFYRSIPLPIDADESTIKATSEKGVITVTIPKKPGASPKKILVQSKD